MCTPFSVIIFVSGTKSCVAGSSIVHWCRLPIPTTSFVASLVSDGNTSAPPWVNPSGSINVKSADSGAACCSRMPALDRLVAASFVPLMSMILQFLRFAARGSICVRIPFGAAQMSPPRGNAFSRW